MVLKPRLKKFLTLYPISTHAWGVRGGDGEFWSLRSEDQDAIRCLGVVLPFLNGSATRQEILTTVVNAGLASEAGEELLQKLEAAGLIEDADNATLTSHQVELYGDQIKLFSRFTTQGGAKHQAALLGSRIAVAGEGALAEALCRSLAASGIGQVTALLPQLHDTVSSATELLPLDSTTIFPSDCLNPKPRAVVVAQTAHDPELLEAMDVFSKKHTVPWLLVRSIEHTEAWVGPLFVPDNTASYVSFEARFRSNMPDYDSYVEFDSYVRKHDGQAVEVGGLHAFHDVLAGIAVTELIKLVTGVAVPVLAGKFISIDLWRLNTEIHEVLRFPRIEDEAYSRPGVFPWKDLPYGRKTRRA